MAGMSEHEKNERVMARWSRNVGLLTAIIVIVNVITAAIMWKQMDVMRGQLDEAKTSTLITQTQLKANLRRDPIVIMAVDKTKLKPELSGVAATVDMFDVKVTWTNAGLTSATDFKGWIKATVIDPNGRPARRLEEDCPKPDPAGNILGFTTPTTIPPQGSMTYDAKFLLSKTTTGINNPLVLIYGFVEYQDVFPDSPTHQRSHHDDWCIHARQDDTVIEGFSFWPLKETVN
jgi:hypothetical protein